MALPEGLEPSTLTLEVSCSFQLSYGSMDLFISPLRNKRGNNEKNQKKNKCNTPADPNRAQNPPPRPGDVTSQLECNKDNGQKADKANTTSRSRSVIRRH